jgi:hypothetical protein
MPANIPYKPFCLELARGCLTIASLPRLVEAISPGTPQRGFYSLVNAIKIPRQRYIAGILYAKSKSSV